ncbi:MAG TPA: zinc ribbon domain-containing protein [Gemmatimonadales bacterium]|nr:zinc ribbon domain-containing protein [Gemmatimonadales bacterium]
MTNSPPAHPAAAAPTRCPSCGTEGGGRFCSKCGTPLGPPVCRHCQAELRRESRFCHRCGRPVDAGGRTPWIVASMAIVILVATIVWYVVRVKPAAEAPQMANNGALPAAEDRTPGGAPPDISQMTPRERFDRLYDRIVRALEQNDSTTVLRFAPMAFSAYAQLDSVDALARFDVGTLRATLGDEAGASALADTILVRSPHHLFGYMLQGTVADFQNNKAALEQSYRNFLASYDAELKSGKPEYRIHQPLVDDFHDRALGRK